MTITVETGTGDNAAANSYVSVADFQTYADARGYGYPDTDAAIEKLLIKSMDYLEGKRSRYQGYKQLQDQPLQWPRSGIVIDGYVPDAYTIPNELIRAQCELAVAAYTVSLQPDILTTSTGQVQRKKIDGAVEVQYFESPSIRSQPQFTAAERLLAPLYKQSGFMVERA